MLSVCIWMRQLRNETYGNTHQTLITIKISNGGP
jgi:hypothetical protein